MALHILIGLFAIVTAVVLAAEAWRSVNKMWFQRPAWQRAHPGYLVGFIAVRGIMILMAGTAAWRLLSL